MDNNQQRPLETAPSPQVYERRAIGQLNTDRSLMKYILLNIVTLGIYSLVFYSVISSDINIIAGRYDGKRTMHFCLLAFIIAPLTMGIGVWVWYHRLSNRIGDELARRHIRYDFNATTFWLWNVLGSFIIVGPFIYLHKLATASNMLAAHYNIEG